MVDFLRQYRLFVVVIVVFVAVIILLEFVGRSDLSSDSPFFKFFGGGANVMDTVAEKDNTSGNLAESTLTSGINILAKNENVLENTVEVIFVGKVIENIYVDDGFNKVDFVPDDYSQKITFVLNDSSMDSFPLTLVDEKGNSTSKSTKVSTIRGYLAEEGEVQIKCNILDSEIFAKECNHDKCDLWTDDVARFRQTWDNYVETGAWPTELGFCVSIDIKLK